MTPPPILTRTQERQRVLALACLLMHDGQASAASLVPELKDEITAGIRYLKTDTTWELAHHLLSITKPPR